MSDPSNTQIAKGKVVLDAYGHHRIRGVVHHARGKTHNGQPIDPNLDVELISHVKGGLYQGGSPDFGRLALPDGFDYVLNLYPWGGYDVPEGVEHDKVTMYDALDQGFEQVEELAQRCADRLDAGDTILVHCQAGLNRSGLLAARTLMLWDGMSADDAINLLRDTRDPLVLCNEAFEGWLRSR